MVKIGETEYRSGFILYAETIFSEEHKIEAIENAKAFCKKHGLTPQNVSIRHVKKNNDEFYNLIVAQVI